MQNVQVEERVDTTTVRSLDEQATDARVGVLDARTVLADWKAREKRAAADIVALEASSGEAYLSDPAAMVEVPKRLRELRDQVAIAVTAQAAQADRVKAAESVWLSVQADVLEAALRATEAQLATHDAKTVKLLAVLEAHNGPYVTEAELARARNLARPYVAGLPNSWTNPKSQALAAEVAAARVPVATLRALAAGLEPVEPERAPFAEAVSIYPECVWGPDALVPAPKYLAHTERLEGMIADHRDAVEEADAEIERLKSLIASESPQSEREVPYAGQLAGRESVREGNLESIAGLEKQLRGRA